MNKRHILEEIKRTAKANGGVALGHRKFYSETGIKYSDWHGVYWARWSDAVREAGLLPNQKTEAYFDELLIGKIVALCRQLGHFPVSGDLRVKAHDDTGFPSDRPFRRLGSKLQLVSKVAEYCRERENLGDVLAMCEAIAQEDNAQLDEVKATTEEIGFVYLPKGKKLLQDRKEQRLGAAGTRACDSASGESEHRACDSH